MRLLVLASLAFLISSGCASPFRVEKLIEEPALAEHVLSTPPGPGRGPVALTEVLNA